MGMLQHVGIGRAAPVGLAIMAAIGVWLADAGGRPAHAFGWGTTYTEVVVTSAVKLRLRDPSSAFFGPMDVFEGRRWHGKRVTAVCGSVDSKGTVDGYRGYSGPVNYVFVSDHFTVYLDSIGGRSAFARAWNALCVGGAAAARP